MKRSCIVEAAIGVVIFAAHSPPWAQVASRPLFDQFEVATIRAVPPDDTKAGRYIRMQSAHRFQVKNYTVHGMIAAAYNLNPKMISGDPAWAKADLYDVLALTPGELRPSYDDQMRMLRRLLRDRFNLTFHLEKKAFSAYELVLAKDGPRLKPSSAPPDEPYNLTSTIFPASSGGIDHARLPARNVTMQQFASVLQRAILDRPVADNTGLTERYDFDLEWTPDEREFGGQLTSGPPDSDKPRLFDAVEEQLGLKLVSAAHIPIDTLIVDHLERPSEN